MICSSARQLLLAEGLASERLASLKKNWGHFLSLNVNEESEHHSLYVLDLPHRSDGRLQLKEEHFLEHLPRLTWLLLPW
jgi:hypothetical protein